MFVEDYDGALGVFTEMAYLAQESGGIMVFTTGNDLHVLFIVKANGTFVLL